MKNLCLIEIEKLLRGNGKSLKNFKKMPQPDYTNVAQFGNKFIADELSYNRDEMARIHDQLSSMLSPEQKTVYNEIVDSIESGSGVLSFYMDMEE